MSPPVAALALQFVFRLFIRENDDYFEKIFEGKADIDQIHASYSAIADALTQPEQPPPLGKAWYTALDEAGLGLSAAVSSTLASVLPETLHRWFPHMLLNCC